MKIEQFTVPLSTRVDRNTALKATALATLLDINRCSGILLAIYCTDPDDLTQNERIQITIDGVVVLNDTAYDIPATDDYIQLLASIAEGAVHSGTGIATNPGSQLDAKIGIPFQHNLKIEYLRAAAGTTGLTINIVFAVRDTIIPVDIS